MDNLVWTPVLHFLLICCFHWEWSLFWRSIWRSSLLWLSFEILVSVHVLTGSLYSMRVDDLVFLLNIEGLKVVSVTYSLHSIVASMLTLVIRVNTFGIVVSHNFVYHLSPPWSSHKMLVVLHKVVSFVFGHLVESGSRSQESVVIVILMLNMSLLPGRDTALPWIGWIYPIWIFLHYHLLRFIIVRSLTIEISAIGSLSSPVMVTWTGALSMLVVSMSVSPLGLWSTIVVMRRHI